MQNSIGWTISSWRLSNESSFSEHGLGEAVADGELAEVACKSKKYIEDYAAYKDDSPLLPRPILQKIRVFVVLNIRRSYWRFNGNGPFGRLLRKQEQFLPGPIFELLRLEAFGLFYGPLCFLQFLPPSQSEG